VDAQHRDERNREHAVSNPSMIQVLCTNTNTWFRPPVGVLTMVGTLATKVHKTMHYCETDETMVCCSYIPSSWNGS
jgi:hypothetical protein